MSLHSKMAEVAKGIGHIEKKGKNQFHGYEYVREEDVIAEVRKALAKQGVALYVGSRIVETRPWKTPKGKDTLITNVEVELTFADGETGEVFTVPGAGTGDDPSDKGTYKAITGAVKYALMKTFLIATGDDPEQTEEAPAPARVSQGNTAKPIDPNTKRNLQGAFLGLKSLVGEQAAKQFVADTLREKGAKTFDELSLEDGEIVLNHIETYRLQQAEAIPA